MNHVTEIFGSMVFDDATMKEKLPRDVYKALRKTEMYMAIQYDYIEEILPREIFFITTQELADMFPDNTPKEREYFITKAKGAVCIMQIGDKLENGEPHDGRAPDYDDWALNADILVYYPVLDIALELSSMGIRVDKEALLSQLEKAGCPERAELPFQKAVLNEELPYTIGGGILGGKGFKAIQSGGPSARRTSEKCSAPSGRMKSAKRRKPTESSCCKQ